MRNEKKHTGRLIESKVSKNPYTLFSRWFNEASKAGFREPSAMVLATTGSNAIPSARMVLLKTHDENGFVFYTNYESRKGKELAENPKATLLFYWDKLDKQVRIEGTVEKVSQKESEDYFKTRPLKSRIGAWASHQSTVIRSRSVIVTNFLKYLAKFKTDVPLPSYWGGYRLKPHEFEFWQGRPNRLHDRLRYRADRDNWKIERLAP